MSAGGTATNSADAGENLKADVAEIHRALTLLCHPNEVYELRALGTSKGTASGYFDSLKKLAMNSVECSGRLSTVGVYYHAEPGQGEPSSSSVRHGSAHGRSIGNRFSSPKAPRRPTRPSLSDGAESPIGRPKHSKNKRRRRENNQRSAVKHSHSNILTKSAISAVETYVTIQFK
jgi:hypothetical protein